MGRGDFAEAFWLCSQSWQALDTMEGVGAAAYLMQVVTGCYEQVTGELGAAMQAVCERFDGAAYSKVHHLRAQRITLFQVPSENITVIDFADVREQMVL